MSEEDTTMQTSYLLLKTAQGLFGKAPSALEPAELAKARGLAERQSALEARVLAAPEARSVHVPSATLDSALDAIRARYADETAFRDDLAGNGLDLDSFTQALARELRVEAILDQVGARAEKASDLDVELYYHFHPEQFGHPEIRRARHILITVNEAYPDNTRAEARRRIEAIAARLAKSPARFEEQALKHSECPTALHGGLLGDVPRGKLFASLDAALFALDAGALSDIVESELGFHVLLCESVRPAGTLPLADVRASLRERLDEGRRKLAIRSWLKSLPSPGVLS